ncbi:MAG: agmatine deiminase family protein [Verrucomicrobiota bacterium]
MARAARPTSPYILPPEWAPQECIWLSWPHRRDLWNGKIKRAQEVFAEIASVISRTQMVRINSTFHHHSNIAKFLVQARADPNHIDLCDHANDDVWCRDHGPLFVKHRETGEVVIGDWRFNGWGKQFAPYDADDAVPACIEKATGLRRIRRDFVLEGGAIEMNGAGQLLTTESVLLNPNRNPHYSRGEVEQVLRHGLGASQVLWLEKGIEGDDTGGHIDDVARFVSDDHLLVSTEADSGKPNHLRLKENLERLKSYRTAGGKRFQLTPLPLPDPQEVPDWRLPVLPASYVNFLIINQAVLVPQFGNPSKDQQALEAIRSCFPSREAIGIPCLDLALEGGTIHCISCQQPK